MWNAPSVENFSTGFVTITFLVLWREALLVSLDCYD